MSPPITRKNGDPEVPPYKQPNVGNDIYGERRLTLAILVRDILNATEMTWFLDGGTLLGAYRNGKNIPHDDDFDTAIYLSEYGGPKDLAFLKQTLEQALPEPYAVRIVTSYAHKLEVFDPTSYRYDLPAQFYKGADFHAVTVDVQVMTDKGDSVVYLHDLLKHIRIPKRAIEPTGKIQCEGVGSFFNCPHLVKPFLKALYGYLGVDSRFDPISKMYQKLIVERDSEVGRSLPPIPNPLPSF